MKFYSIIRSSDRISGNSSDCLIQCQGRKELSPDAILKCTGHLYIDGAYTTNNFIEMRSSNIGIVNQRDTNTKQNTILFYDKTIALPFEFNCVNFTKKNIDFKLVDDNGDILPNELDTAPFDGKWVLYLKCEEIK